MIESYLDYILGQLLPKILQLLNSLMIANGVSWIGLILAVTMLCIVIGSILMRVS